MKIATLHPNEKQRLESLQALNILDSLPESDFDQITQLASEICGTPIALISLVDRDRQWFKSKVGLNADQTPRDLAFCAHAILQDDVFVVENSSNDERFFDNPLATGGPNVQFYAGAPLLSPDGLPIGTVCVIDTKPRSLSTTQATSLKSLSNQVTRLLKLRTKIKKLEESELQLRIRNIAIETISEGVLILDAQGNLIDVNSSALRILNLTRENIFETIAKRPNWSAICEDGTPLALGEHPSEVVLRTGLAANSKVVGIMKENGDHRWLQVSALPILKKIRMSFSALRLVSQILPLRLKIKKELRKINSNFASF
ncbi:MAG: GAF domain-containing protein [Pseudobdellovibrio sp.]